MKEISLFSRKDMYIMSHDKKGRATFLKESFKRSPMYRYDNLHLANKIHYTKYNGIDIPIMDPYEGSLDFEFFPYTSYRKLEGKGQALHFFQNDDKFRYAVWNRLEETTFKLKEFDLLLAPDFTMFVDMPSFYALQSVYMTRFVGAYWQNCGYNVLPTVSWSNVDSFDFTFLGLPTNSPIAVCGVGVRKCKGSLELWHLGLLELEEKLHPTIILIYGDETIPLPNLHTPVKFITDNITKFFRNGRTKKNRD